MATAKNEKGTLRGGIYRHDGRIPPSDADVSEGERPLDLAAPLRANVSRLSYEGEGLRLTWSIGWPSRYVAEVELSRADAEWLIKRLQDELADAAMPKGSAR